MMAARATFRRVFAVFLIAASFAASLAQDAGGGANPSLDFAARQQHVRHAAIQKLAPCIVRIDTIGGAQPVRREMNRMQQERTAAGFRQADGPTTGLTWSADGYILTSSFNFVRDPVVITVTLADGRRFVARLVARDRTARLALLKIDAADLPVPEWRDTARLRSGQWSLAAGYGFGSEQPAVALGILSALHRMSGQAVQTDARISPAHYGGPLFDIEGRVIGICVPMGLDRDEMTGIEWYDSGIGFAVHYEHLQRRVPRLMEGRDLHHGLLGIDLESREPVVGIVQKADRNGPPPSRDGLRIRGEPRGPAAQAGLQAGDVITRIDDLPTPTITEFRRAVARNVAGDTVTVTYRRDETTTSVTLRLASAEDFVAAPTTQPK